MSIELIKINLKGLINSIYLNFYLESIHLIRLWSHELLFRVIPTIISSPMIKKKENDQKYTAHITDAVIRKHRQQLFARL